MTDQRSETAPKKATRRIPPLVWIVLALLVGWLVVALLQRGGIDNTPQGGSHPMQAEGTSVMPAAPAQGDAPATPSGAINGPAQPEVQ
jgi:hypothetical protein